MDGSAVMAGLAALVHDVRNRYAYAIVAANVLGAFATFLFLAFVLPVAGTTRHQDIALAVNVAAFVVSGLISIPLAWRWSATLWRERLGWIAAGRSPTDRERELTLRYPLSQQAVVAVMWGAGAIEQSVAAADVTQFARRRRLARGYRRIWPQ